MNVPRVSDRAQIRQRRAHRGQSTPPCNRSICWLDGGEHVPLARCRSSKCLGGSTGGILGHTSLLTTQTTTQRLWKRPICDSTRGKARRAGAGAGARCLSGSGRDRGRYDRSPLLERRLISVDRDCLLCEDVSRGLLFLQYMSRVSVNGLLTQMHRHDLSTVSRVM